MFLDLHPICFPSHGMLHASDLVPPSSFLSSLRMVLRLALNGPTSLALGIVRQLRVTGYAWGRKVLDATFSWKYFVDKERCVIFAENRNHFTALAYDNRSVGVQHLLHWQCS